MPALADPADDLKAEIAAASPGDVIKTANADFGDLILVGYSFEPAVKVRFHKNATITSMEIRGVTGMTFNRAKIVAGVADRPVADKAVFVFGGSKITFNNANIQWAADGDPLNDGVGMIFEGVQGLTVNRSTFTNALSGIIIRSSTNAKVKNSSFSEILGDGVKVSGTDGVLIKGNSCTNFTSAPNVNPHPDCIQLLAGSRAVGNTNTRILSNTITKGDGASFQGIFMGTGVDGEMHVGVRIENNSITQSVGLGIAAIDVDGLTIRNNQVLPSPDATTAPRILVNDPTINVLIEGNTASAINAPEHATLINNTILE